MSGLTLVDAQGRELKPKCTVHIDNKVETFSDFVAIGFDKKVGQVKVMHNCDILTLTVGMEVLHNTMNDMYSKMPQAEKDIVDKYFAEMEATNREQNRVGCTTRSAPESSGDDAVPCETNPEGTQH
jgi:hypothetical protein